MPATLLLLFAAGIVGFIVYTVRGGKTPVENVNNKSGNDSNEKVTMKRDVFLHFMHNNGLEARRDDVIKAVGKPNYTEEDSGGARWYYRNRTVDPTTGKRDSLTIVEFGDPHIGGYRAGYEHVSEVRFR